MNGEQDENTTEAPETEVEAAPEPETPAPVDEP